MVTSLFTIIFFEVESSELLVRDEEVVIISGIWAGGLFEAAKEGGDSGDNDSGRDLEELSLKIKGFLNDMIF